MIRGRQSSIEDHHKLNRILPTILANDSGAPDDYRRWGVQLNAPALIYDDIIIALRRTGVQLNAPALIYDDIIMALRCTGVQLNAPTLIFAEYTTISMP